MNRTRNERKRDRTLLIYLIGILVFAVTLYALIVIGFPEEEEVATESVVIEATDLPVVQCLPDVPEEVANKEAQMPEFGYNYEYVVSVVASECRGEPYEGQIAVAQCIKNSAESKMLTPEEVVKLPNRYANPCESATDIELVRDACCAVFVHNESVTDEPIEYFYSTVGGFVSAWHENNLEFVMEIGNHRFFKEK